MSIRKLSKVLQSMPLAVRNDFQNFLSISLAKVTPETRKFFRRYTKKALYNKSNLSDLTLEFDKPKSYVKDRLHELWQAYVTFNALQSISKRQQLYSLMEFWLQKKDYQEFVLTYNSFKKHLFKKPESSSDKYWHWKAENLFQEIKINPKVKKRQMSLVDSIKYMDKFYLQESIHLRGEQISRSKVHSEIVNHNALFNQYVNETSETDPLLYLRILMLQLVSTPNNKNFENLKHFVFRSSQVIHEKELLQGYVRLLNYSVREYSKGIHQAGANYLKILDHLLALDFEKNINADRLLNYLKKCIDTEKRKQGITLYNKCKNIKHLTSQRHHYELCLIAAGILQQKWHYSLEMLDRFKTTDPALNMVSRSFKIVCLYETSNLEACERECRSSKVFIYRNKFLGESTTQVKRFLKYTHTLTQNIQDKKQLQKLKQISKELKFNQTTSFGCWLIKKIDARIKNPQLLNS